MNYQPEQTLHPKLSIDQTKTNQIGRMLWMISVFSLVTSVVLLVLLWCCSFLKVSNSSLQYVGVRGTFEYLQQRELIHNSCTKYISSNTRPKETLPSQTSYPSFYHNASQATQLILSTTTAASKSIIGINYY